MRCNRFSRCAAEKWGEPDRFVPEPNVAFGSKREFAEPSGASSPPALKAVIATFVTKVSTTRLSGTSVAPRCSPLRRGSLGLGSRVVLCAFCCVHFTRSALFPDHRVRFVQTSAADVDHECRMARLGLVWIGLDRLAVFQIWSAGRRPPGLRSRAKRRRPSEKRLTPFPVMVANGTLHLAISRRNG